MVILYGVNHRTLEVCRADSLKIWEKNENNKTGPREVPDSSVVWFESIMKTHFEQKPTLQ